MSFLGVAAPIGLLAIAWTADRLLHHPIGTEPLPPSTQYLVTLETPEPPRDVFEEMAATCGGPDSVELCTPAYVDVMFGARLGAISDRAGLERRWLAELAAGDHVAAYGLAWLASERALPELRRQLLADRYFYGWETSYPDPPDSVYADSQYPHHQAYLAAIEKISWMIAGHPVRHPVKLTRAERAQLRRDAAGCDDWRAAVWLLHELDGAPLPGTARNRAKRIRCEGPWLPGDPGYNADE